MQRIDQRTSSKGCRVAYRFDNPCRECRYVSVSFDMGLAGFKETLWPYRYKSRGSRSTHGRPSDHHRHSGRSVLRNIRYLRLHLEIKPSVSSCRCPGYNVKPLLHTVHSLITVERFLAVRYPYGEVRLGGLTVPGCLA